jgi:LCP family protein required for cell wall assembly
MVRRKEDDMPAREVSIRVAKKAPAVADEPTPRLRRPLSARRKGGAGKAIIVTLVVIILLAGGWFAARAAVVGMDLLNSGKPSWLATLLNIKITQLVGEEDGRVNVLLLGFPGDPAHDGPNLTDTVILASYNTVDQYLHMVSLPRDLEVKSDDLGTMKLNAVFQTGQSKNSDGPGTILKTIDNLTGLATPYYIKIDFAGFKQLVDELGGIKVDVKKDLLDPRYPADAGDGYQTVDIKAGSYTMDGEMALKYARSRESTSDFDRARRQQDILMAMRSKASELDLLTAPTKLFAISDIIKDHLTTNLNKDEMVRLMQLMAEFDPTKVTNKVVDEASGVVAGGKNAAGIYVLAPVGGDYNKIKEYVATSITQTTAEVETPAEVEVTPLKIEVLNGTTTTGLAGKAAEKLKTDGYTIVKVGNNTTKGVTATLVYGSDTISTAALQALATKVGGTVSTDKVTLATGIEARVVLGANYPTQ